MLGRFEVRRLGGVGVVPWVELIRFILLEAISLSIGFPFVPLLVGFSFDFGPRLVGSCSGWFLLWLFSFGRFLFWLVPLSVSSSFGQFLFRSVPLPVGSSFSQFLFWLVPLLVSSSFGRFLFRSVPFLVGSFFFGFLF